MIPLARRVLGSARGCPVVAVMGLAACSSSGIATDTGSLVTNADGASTVAGEMLTEDGGDFTHGILTIENATDEPLTLRGVRLVDPVGDIEVVDSYVAPEGRSVLYVSSDDSFPPDSDVQFALRPLAGFELQPFPQREGKQRNVAVVLQTACGWVRAVRSESSGPRRTSVRTANSSSACGA